MDITQHHGTSSAEAANKFDKQTTRPQRMSRDPSRAISDNTLHSDAEFASEVLPRVPNR
jgi:hypothetical protein